MNTECGLRIWKDTEWGILRAEGANPVLSRVAQFLEGDIQTCKESVEDLIAHMESSESLNIAPQFYNAHWLQAMGDKVVITFEYEAVNKIVTLHKTELLLCLRCWQTAIESGDVPTK